MRSTPALRRIEVTSFVNPERVPQMADAEAVMAERARRPAAAATIGLVLNRRGLRARDRRPAATRSTVVVVATDTFGHAATRASTPPTQIGGLCEAIAPARDRPGSRPTVIAGSRVRLPLRGRGADRAGASRSPAASRRPAPHEIAIADTIGVAVPAARALDRLDAVASRCRRSPLRAHFHNTRNTGFANALAAYEAGVTALDASLGGIGGCPFAPSATGNIATEDLVYLLERSGIGTGIDLASIAATGSWISELVGYPQAPAMLGRAGSFPR